MKKILVDKKHFINIIFLAVYNDLGLEKDPMTLTVMPHIGFTGKIKQTIGEVVLYVYAEEGNMSTNFLVINYASY